MNVLVDFHHAGLLNSLILLFEKRFGWKVYRPIGREWFDEGFWKIYDHPATVAQYLDIGGATPDNSQKLNEVELGDDGIYLCHDICSEKTNRAITLNKFRKTNFGVVLASIPDHILPYQQLANEHFTRPRFIYQIGNNFPPSANGVSNLMSSALISETAKNKITYHQEFDLDIFRPTQPIECPKKITSLVNCFSLDKLFEQDWQLFQKIENLMPDYEFKCIGGQCRDGSANGEKEVAKTIQESGFIWHTKAGGDGYGHIIHNAGACARPMIVKKEYYKGKLGEALMIDGETCICIDNLSPDEIIKKIRFYSEFPRYAQMCNEVIRNFRKNVDFDKEEKELRHFFANLV